nr:glycoprotein vIgFam12 [Elephant endotheliotropic herpesvirus 1A]
MGGGTLYVGVNFVLVKILVISAKNYICFQDLAGYQERTNVTLTGVNDQINITLPLGQNGTHKLIHNRTIEYTNTTHSIYLNTTHITLSNFCTNGSGQYILQSEEDIYTTCTFVDIYTNCDRPPVRMDLSKSCRLDYVISTCLVLITLVEFL